MKKLMLILLSGLLLSVGVACGDDDEETVTPPANNSGADMGGENNNMADMGGDDTGMDDMGGENNNNNNNMEDMGGDDTGMEDMDDMGGEDEPDMEEGDPLCEEYCDTLFEACNGARAQYDTPTQCLEVCATLSRDGMDGDVDGDTIQCRIYHAGVARDTDPSFHCPHAGPSGGGVCVDGPPPACDTYCGIMLETCQGVYENADACQTACAAFPDDGALGDAMGNSVQCRSFYASLATDGDLSEEDQADFCANAAPEGNGVCGLPFGQIDRMGRPAINTALIGADDKDNYNQSTLADREQFVEQMTASLAFVDGLDGSDTNGLFADNRGALAGALAADFLVIDISVDDCTNGYLAIELVLLGLAEAYTVCGGRTLEEDVMDKTLQVLVDAGATTVVTDSVDANDVPFSTDFPYLAAPSAE